jgi:tetratricopeptide (TPR) repeat protein
MKRFMKAKITVLVLLAVMVTGYAEAFVTSETDVASLGTSFVGSEATIVNPAETTAVNPEGSVARPDSVTVDNEASQVGVGITPEMAIEAYRNQDYKRSIELYETLVASGLEENRESAQLYFNLGNAYFRDHQLGKAILNYERAHLLAPPAIAISAITCATRTTTRKTGLLPRATCSSRTGSTGYATSIALTRGRGSR